ncbi:hypothetical protein [Cereibacter sphaeroides]|jgi:hypothetical protein|uniref:hypothetical protein n=1 Tax=Cereibacter sphaeroides TaxID=1063 RepID=UPI00006653EC|nr:hypothetical protein Rsph17029_3374 [Cereibacter sphaeroides ATCC 17029]
MIDLNIMASPAPCIMVVNDSTAAARESHNLFHRNLLPKFGPTLAIIPIVHDAIVWIRKYQIALPQRLQHSREPRTTPATPKGRRNRRDIQALVGCNDIAKHRQKRRYCPSIHDHLLQVVEEMGVE